jgi:hypothetical protein
MTHSVNVLDRLRIERVVWSLDQQLYELPRKSRIATRREVRDNLHEAARNVGTQQALAGVGSTRELASEYLTAQFGSGPRASWLSAGVFLFTAVLVLTSLLFDAAAAFGDGVLAGDPDASGTYTWSGIAYLQNDVTYTIQNGQVEQAGGAFSVLTWVLLGAGAVLVGRLWRALPSRR